MLLVTGMLPILLCIKLDTQQLNRSTYSQKGDNDQRPQSSPTAFDGVCACVFCMYVCVCGSKQTNLVLA